MAVWHIGRIVKGLWSPNLVRPCREEAPQMRETLLLINVSIRPFS